MKKQYDVVIIGAGVVGSAIARELSRYKLSIAVLEKNLDVCNETSGRNSAVVHGGFANPTGSLKAKCCVEGNRIMDQLAEELNFPFKRCGKVLVGNTPEDMEQLERTMKQGAVNGCTGLEMIDEAKLHELVPAVVGKFAMWSKNSGIMDPFLYTVALAENAHANGVDFFFDHKVTAITRENELYYLHTEHGDVCTRWVVNAAGLGAKQISDLLGLTGYRVIGSRSNYIILHKRMGKLLPMPVYPVPSNTYMGIHITPTVDGNVTVGPDAENTDVLDDYSVPQANMDSLAVEGAKLWPHIFKKDQIRTFAGIQPKWVDENGAIQDWKVEIRDDVAPNAVNLVGIESPGLTGSVPLARYVIGLMLEHEKFEANPGFDPHHKGIVKFAECTPEQQAELIAQDPDYGEMICSCEEVTKAEILQAIRQSSAPVLYICNVMTQPGETGGYTVSDHLKALIDHVGGGVIDFVLANNAVPKDDVLKKYAKVHAAPVKIDREKVKRMGVQLIEADLLGPLRGATQDTKVLTEELAQIHNLLKVNIPPEALEEYLKRSH